MDIWAGIVQGAGNYSVSGVEKKVTWYEIVRQERQDQKQDAQDAKRWAIIEENVHQYPVPDAREEAIWDSNVGIIRRTEMIRG